MITGLRVVVAGAGALGSAVALELARRGASVLLADPAPPGDNASGVAAGMLAPAFETLLDPVGADLFPLLRAARDAWPDFAPPGLVLERTGALFRATTAAEAEAKAAALAAAGARPRLLSADEAAALSPGLVGGPAVFTDEDWRLDPMAALHALHAALRALGGRLTAQAVTGWTPGSARLSDGSQAAADVLVAATAAGPCDLAPELAALQPIKGQILKALSAGPRSGPVVRAAGVYVVPAPDGAVVGATMEAGTNDRRIDPAAVERLRAAAAGLFPRIAEADVLAAAGVRAATADGLPLAGPSRTPGVMLAAGARRNGWLLAPLVARTLAARLAGEDPPAGSRFDPARPLGG